MSMKLSKKLKVQVVAVSLLVVAGSIVSLQAFNGNDKPKVSQKSAVSTVQKSDSQATELTGSTITTMDTPEQAQTTPTQTAPIEPEQAIEPPKVQVVNVRRDTDPSKLVVMLYVSAGSTDITGGTATIAANGSVVMENKVIQPGNIQVKVPAQESGTINLQSTITDKSGKAFTIDSPIDVSTVAG